MDVKPGVIVIAKAGKESGKNFVVCRIDERFAYIADGKRVKLKKLKKKNLKHIEPVAMADDIIVDCLKKGLCVIDKDIRMTLRNKS